MPFYILCVLRRSAQKMHDHIRRKALCISAGQRGLERACMEEKLMYTIRLKDFGLHNKRFRVSNGWNSHLSPPKDYKLENIFDQNRSLLLTFICNCNKIFMMYWVAMGVLCHEGRDTLFTSGFIVPRSPFADLNILRKRLRRFRLRLPELRHRSGFRSHRRSSCWWLPALLES